MRNKVFIQLHPVLLIVDIFYLLIIPLWIFCVMYANPSNSTFMEKWKGGTVSSIVLIILMSLGFFVVLYEGFSFNYHWISFKEKYIYVPCDCRSKIARRQYKVKVDYEYIEDITFVRKTTNSRNGEIRGSSNNPMYHHYLVLMLNDGKKEQILVDYFTKKQKVKIMDEVICRLRTYGKVIEREKVEESLNALGMFGSALMTDFVEQMDENKKNRKKKKDK